MPALLERPKMTKTMAVALHRHIMRERERKRQEEEEADKIMEQKMKEEQQRRRKKEEEERMSLEETREQEGNPLQATPSSVTLLMMLMTSQAPPTASRPAVHVGTEITKLEEKLQALQDEKHQLFLQLKKVLNEEDKRRAKIKEQNELAALSQQPYPAGMTVHPGSHLIMHGSHISPSRAHGLLGDRPKNQLYSHTTIPGRAYPSQTTFTSSQPEHTHFQPSQSGHSSYASSQPQHSVAYTGGQAVPATYPAGSQPIRGYLAPATSMPLQKQLEHANQQSGFSDTATLRSLHPQSLHAGQTLLQPTQLQSGMIYPHQTRPASPGAFQHGGTPPQPSHSATFSPASQQTQRHHFIQHGQTQRYYK